jgi:hypothetical protein
MQGLHDMQYALTENSYIFLQLLLSSSVVSKIDHDHSKRVNYPPAVKLAVLTTMFQSDQKFDRSEKYLNKKID